MIAIGSTDASLWIGAFVDLGIASQLRRDTLDRVPFLAPAIQLGATAVAFDWLALSAAVGVGHRGLGNVYRVPVLFYPRISVGAAF